MNARPVWQPELEDIEVEDVPVQLSKRIYGIAREYCVVSLQQLFQQLTRLGIGVDAQQAPRFPFAFHTPPHARRRQIDRAEVKLTSREVLHLRCRVAHSENGA